MLVIRLQRTGRKNHVQYRVVVQDSRVTPSSGRVVCALGHYDPHAKKAVIDQPKAELYLKNGAQPSGRMAAILKAEGVKLPEWVKLGSTSKQKSTRHAEKLRRNRPAAEIVDESTAPEAAAEEPASEESTPVEA